MSNKRRRVFPVTSEKRSEYLTEEAKYFKNLGDHKRPGASAADAAFIDPHLPSREAEHKMLERWEWGLTKASRSGAFSKPGSGPAIFPGGLAKTMAFIDECTPGKFKEPVERPVLTEQTRRVDAPRAAVVYDKLCVDCLNPIDFTVPKGWVVSLFIIDEQDISRLMALGVKFGDSVLMVEHMSCARKARKEQEDASPIILVRGGEMADERDLEIAYKHGLIQRLHSGHEITAGQWAAAKRQERLVENMRDILVALPKDSPYFTKNRPREEE